MNSQEYIFYIKYFRDSPSSTDRKKDSYQKKIMSIYFLLIFNEL